MKRILTAFIFISLLISCADENKNGRTDDSLSFSSKTIEKTMDNCQPEEGDCTFISLNFPVAENDQASAEKINEKIQDFLNRTIDYQDEGGTVTPEELTSNFIENYKKTAKDFPEYELPWEATISGNVLYKSPHLISIRFKTDMFTGGAHGYRSTNYLNFDPAGNLLKAKDLFTPEFIDYVEQDFRKKQNIPANSNINSTGMFFENDVFHLPQNIGFTKDSVILHYNAYEIAPYASGNFTLKYSKTEIMKFLKVEISKKQVQV